MINFIKAKILENKEKKERQEQERLYQQERKKEEERKKIEELNKKEQKFNENLKRLFIDNSICISLVGINLCSMHKYVIKAINTLDLNVGEDILYNNFIDIYKLVEDTQTIEKFEQKVNREELKKIFKKNFKCYINTDNDIYTNKIIEIVFDNTIDELIMQESLCGGGEIVRLAIERAKSCLNGETDIDFERYSIAWISLMYAVALNKLLILLKYKENYIKNQELYNITINLYKELNEFKLVTEKLYPIYEEYYKDTFHDRLNPRQLGILACLINKENAHINANIEEGILELGNELGVFNNLNENNIVYSELQNIIMSIGEYFINEEWQIIYIYCSIVKMYIDNIDIKELLNIYSKLDELSDIIKKRKKQKEIELERERYLNNDFRKEMQIKEDNYDFENIKTGVEFELYLKKIFTKIGYRVETTKTTGDQGADLIIYKNKIKTVVQAKFYSNPVGNKAVQEVVGAIKFYNADKGMVVTNSVYTKSALELADANNIELIDGEKLNQLRASAFASN